MDEPEKFDYNKNSGRGEYESREHNRLNLERFEKEIEESPCDTLLISGEHFVLYNKEEIMRLKEYLSKIADTIEVIFYARHPVSQVGSYVQESVKNGARSLASVAEQPPFLRFGNILPAWAEVFGKDAMRVRPFQEERLEGGNVIIDLASIAGVECDALAGKEIRENEGLSMAAVLIADALAKQAPRFSERRGPQNYLKRIQGPKYVPDSDIVEKTREVGAPHVQYLIDEWGVTLYDPVMPDPPLEPFDADAIASIAEIMNGQARKLSLGSGSAES